MPFDEEQNITLPVLVRDLPADLEAVFHPAEVDPHSLSSERSRLDIAFAAGEQHVIEWIKDKLASEVERT